MVVALNAQFVLNGVKHFEDPGQFGFGEQADVQVEFGATIRFLALPVLADQNKRGEKDRLRRNHRGEKTIRVWIVRFHSEPTRVQRRQRALDCTVHYRWCSYRLGSEVCQTWCFALLVISPMHGLWAPSRVGKSRNLYSQSSAAIIIFTTLRSDADVMCRPTSTL